MNIPVSKPFINKEIRRAVIKTIKSGRYILDKYSAIFEKKFAEYIGTKHAILVSSGTAAIFLSLISLDVKEGDEILVPSFTSFPTIEPILHLKATPIFIDICENYTIDIEDMKEKLSPRTVGIIPVHIYGHPVKLDDILHFSNKNGLFVIEDCCQAHGAEFKGQRVGSFGNAGCFSFYPSRNLTVFGDGGIVTTNDKNIIDKINMLRNHGRESRYEHKLVGFNFRFNEIQAAVGIEQLKYLDSFNNRRHEIATLYKKYINNENIILPIEEIWAKHVFNIFVIRNDNRDKLRSFLRFKGISTEIHYPIPCHLQPAIKQILPECKLPLTESFCNTIMSLPIFPMLKNREVKYICKQINDFVNTNH